MLNFQATCCTKLGFPNVDQHTAYWGPMVIPQHQTLQG